MRISHSRVDSTSINFRRQQLVDQFVPSPLLYPLPAKSSGTCRIFFRVLIQDFLHIQGGQIQLGAYWVRHPLRLRNEDWFLWLDFFVRRVRLAPRLAHLVQSGWVRLHRLPRHNVP